MVVRRTLCGVQAVVAGCAVVVLLVTGWLRGEALTSKWRELAAVLAVSKVKGVVLGGGGRRESRGRVVVGSVVWLTIVMDSGRDTTL